MLFCGSGQGQNRNGGGTSFLQNPRALIHRSTGREDIIDQQDAFFPNLRGADQTEGAFHVLHTLMARELHLRPRTAEPHEVIEEQRYREALADAVGQDQCLIKTPVTEPFSMERHRYRQVQMRGHPHLLRHPRSEGLPQGLDRPVLVHMDRFTERSLEQTCCERLVKMGRGCPAGQTFVPWTVGKGLRRTERSAAGGADRSRDRREFRPALAAESGDPGTGNRIAAVGTRRGEEIIEGAQEEIDDLCMLVSKKHILS